MPLNRPDQMEKRLIDMAKHAPERTDILGPSIIAIP